MSILDQLFGTMNVIFGGVMLGLFVFSIVRMRKNPKENTTIPNLIAALGIIGTFAGIFSGLLEFDTNKLDASIPKLLDGMKTAFLTSLIGLVLSNILKCFQSSKVKLAVKNDKNNVGEVSLEKIATLMNEMKNAIVDSNKEVVGAIKDIKENSEKTSNLNKIGMESLVEELTGKKETSLVGQMKVLRESMVEAQEKAQERLNSGLEKMGEQLGSLVKTNNAISTEIERGNDVLIQEFRVFAKNMAENNMKAFTEAIQDCIKDLNNQLQEQFGENFKHLNFAVEKLLDWQVHYKETIEKTNNNQTEIYEGMKIAKDLVIEISNRSSSIVEVANKLGDKIVTFDNQQQNLNSSLEVLNKISKDAVELIPNIDRYTVELNEQLLESTKNIENYMISVDEKMLEHTMRSTESITEHVISTTQKGIEEINKSSKNVLNSINLVNQEAVNNILKLSDYFKKQSIESISYIEEIQESIKESCDILLTKASEVSNKAIGNIEENSSQIAIVRNTIKELTTVSTENIKKQQNEIVNALNNVVTSINTTSEMNVRAIDSQIKSIEKSIVNFENEGFNLTKKISDNIQNMVENNNTNLNKSIDDINKLLATTLNTSLNSLGNQLAAVSEKFVSDYTPLTKELQKIISLAKTGR
ncbi:MAG: hypothetical protein ACRDAS_08425 [Cetobacterium sp.]